MRSIILRVLAVAAVASCAATNTKWEHLFTKCKRGDNDCLAKAISSAVKTIKSGIKELNIPSFDPVHVKELNIGAGTAAVHFDQHYKDVDLIGFSTGNVTNAHLDEDKGLLTFTNVVPKFTQRGQYEMAGQILVAPLKGKGHHQLDGINMECNHTVKFVKETKNGETYLKVTDYDIAMKMEDAHFDFENLFDGNAELSKTLNQLFNDEWKVIFDDIGKGYNEAYAAVFKNFANLIFEKIPVSKLFA